MKIIDIRTHGILDDLTGALLILAPWLFGFADGGIAQWLPQVLGALTLGMSLVTDYEPSLAKLVPHMEMQSAFAGNTANSCAFICAATCGSSKGDHHGRQQER